MVRAILVVMLRELFSLNSEQKFPTMQGVICALTAGGIGAPDPVGLDCQFADCCRNLVYSVL